MWELLLTSSVGEECAANMETGLTTCIRIYTSDRLCYRIQEGQIQLHVLLIDCVAEDKGDRYTTSDRGITLVKW